MIEIQRCSVLCAPIDNRCTIKLRSLSSEKSSEHIVILYIIRGK